MRELTHEQVSDPPELLQLAVAQARRTNGSRPNLRVGTVPDVALARIEILEGRTADEKRKLVDAVARALSDALKAPAADPCVRLLEYPPSQFSVPYPERHSDRYTLVEVTMFAGRSMDTRRRLYRAIVDGFAALDVPEHDILIVLHEPPMHNWGVDGGVPAREVDVGFKVDI